MKNKLLVIAEAVLIAVAILAGSIAVPILCRPFFYLHIAPLHLPENAGLSVQQIKTAYREMMDYCIGLSDIFSVGVLPFSESGAAHFADVRKLFVLDLRVLAAAAVGLTVLKLCRRKYPVWLAGHTPGFWSAAGLGMSVLTVGVLAALDFETAFRIFHQLFFPGKSNWLFSTYQDPVILLLPMEFFRNCAVLILALIIVSCVALLLWDRKKRSV